jgi:creatinine amidohydrolase/Fe(II)-dependent formamide hydrolase-like protein
MAVSGPFSRSEQDKPRFSPSGVWGDPTLASDEKGAACSLPWLMICLPLLRRCRRKSLLKNSHVLIAWNGHFVPEK